MNNPILPQIDIYNIKELPIVQECLPLIIVSTGRQYQVVQTNGCSLLDSEIRRACLLGSILIKGSYDVCLAYVKTHTIIDTKGHISLK